MTDDTVNLWDLEIVRDAMLRHGMSDEQADEVVWTCLEEWRNGTPRNRLGESQRNSQIPRSPRPLWPAERSGKSSIGLCEPSRTTWWAGSRVRWVPSASRPTGYPQHPGRQLPEARHAGRGGREARDG